MTEERGQLHVKRVSYFTRLSQGDFYSGKIRYLASKGFSQEAIDFAVSVDQQLDAKGGLIVWVATQAVKDPSVLSTPIETFDLIKQWIQGSPTSVNITSFALTDAVIASKVWKGNRDFAKKLDDHFHLGGLFDKWVIRELERDPTLRQKSVQEFGHIFDWAVGARPQPNINNFMYEQAKEGSDDWHEILAASAETKSLGPIPGNTIGEITLYTYPDGWSITELPNKDNLRREGSIMGNCLNSSCEHYVGFVVDRGGKILSLRDPNNVPHVSMELSADSKGQFRAQQIRGRSNRAPVEKYKKRLYEFVMNNPAMFKPSTELIQNALPKEQMQEMVRRLIEKNKLPK